MVFERIGKSRDCLFLSHAHRHSAWELCYNIKGAGKWIVGEYTYQFEPGTIMLCPPYTDHTKISLDGFEDCFLHFSGCDFTPKVYFLKDDYDRKLFHLLDILHTVYYEDRSVPVCVALFEAITELVRPMLDCAPQNDHVQRLQQIIIREFSDPEFKLQQALEDIPINCDYLRRLFKKAVGKTPHEYLLQLRIENAKKMLSASKKEVTAIADVALLCGFYDQLYFSRVFRQHTGLSPSQYADISANK